MANDMIFARLSDHNPPASVHFARLSPLVLTKPVFLCFIHERSAAEAEEARKRQLGAGRTSIEAREQEKT